jgi:hypothetical protein
MVQILKDMVQDGADSPDDLENVHIALLTSDPAATLIGMYANKAGTLQMATAGAFALAAGALIEFVHELETADLLSTQAGYVGFIGVILLVVASLAGIYQFGWGAFKLYLAMRAVLTAVSRLRPRI